MDTYQQVYGQQDKLQLQRVICDSKWSTDK